MNSQIKRTKTQLQAEVDELERRLAVREIADFSRGIELSEYILKFIFDKANQGILIHRDSKALYANSTLVKMYGYGSPEEILSLESTKVLTHPDYDLGVHEPRLKGEDVGSVRHVIGLRKDGSEIWEERQSFIIELDGDPAVCSMRLDITERKKIEQSLEESEARYRTLLDGASQGILIHK